MHGLQEHRVDAARLTESSFTVLAASNCVVRVAVVVRFRFTPKRTFSPRGLLGFVQKQTASRSIPNCCPAEATADLKAENGTAP
jgi:hypothetical protein